MKINIKQIKTKRLLIRRFRKDDLDGIYDYASREKAARYVLWPRHRSRKDTKAFLKETFRHYKKGHTFYYAVELVKTGALIGSVGFIPDAERAAVHGNLEIGYSFNPGYRGKGYCAEAVKALIRETFKKLRIRRIQACCNVKNKASERVMKRAGMKKEGTFRKYMVVKGSIWDIHMYSIIKKGRK